MILCGLSLLKWSIYLYLYYVLSYIMCLTETNITQSSFSSETDKKKSIVSNYIRIKIIYCSSMLNILWYININKRANVKKINCQWHRLLSFLYTFFNIVRNLFCGNLLVWKRKRERETTEVVKKEGTTTITLLLKFKNRCFAHNWMIIDEWF